MDERLIQIARLIQQGQMFQARQRAESLTHDPQAAADLISGANTLVNLVALFTNSHTAPTPTQAPMPGIPPARKGTRRHA